MAGKQQPATAAPLTVAERQELLALRRTTAGLKQLRNLWAAPEDEAAIRAFAETRPATARAWAKISPPGQPVAQSQRASDSAHNGTPPHIPATV